MALKDTKGTCGDEMIVPFVALSVEGGCCANPDQPEGQLPMTAPMIAGQILHFKGGWGAMTIGQAGHNQMRHFSVDKIHANCHQM